MPPSKQDTPQAIDEHRTMKARSARSWRPILRGILLVVGVGAFVPSVAGSLYGENPGTILAFGLFVLATYALILTTPKPDAQPLTARQLGFPGWSLLGYCVTIGLGFNWVCVFLWFSRRYAFFSAPVIGVTSLIVVFYAAIALLAGLARGNWRTALIVFVCVAGIPAAIVLRLGLLR